MQLEMQECILSTVATDALVLKHQAISIHSANLTFIVRGWFHTEILLLWVTILENKITWLKKIIQLFKG